MKRKQKSRTRVFTSAPPPKPDPVKAAKIVRAIGRAHILTAYEEANLPLPPKILREFRVAVGLAARPLEVDNPTQQRRLARIAKTSFADRHRHFYNFWEEYFDWKVEVTQLYDESPDWLQKLADEMMNECDWDL